MTIALPDGSRDPRIEDPTNLWIVHPAGRRLLPWFVAHGVSANSVSIGGLLLGAGAASAYAQWHSWGFALVGLALSIGWLIADGLDGMIARATGTASPLGRILDGVCDHGVFVLIYVTLATTLGTANGWVLACIAGLCHALQSNFYEGERARFHRRAKGQLAQPIVVSRVPLVQIYDRLILAADRVAHGFDAALARSADPRRLGTAYADAAARPMHFMSLLTANVRVGAIFIACLVGDPRFFWWFEILALTPVLVAGLLWHRQVEAQFVGPAHPASSSLSHTKDVSKS